MIKGNIGVITAENTGDLYRVRFCNNQPLIKVERISDGWTKWVYASDFWIILDSFAY